MEDLCKDLKELKSLYAAEIRNSTKKPSLTATDYEANCKALDVLIKIETLCNMLEEDDEHQYSERRHRNSMGQFSTRSEMVHRLKEMRHKAPDTETANAISMAIEKLHYPNMEEWP